MDITIDGKDRLQISVMWVKDADAIEISEEQDMTNRTAKREITIGNITILMFEERTLRKVDNA